MSRKTDGKDQKTHFQMERFVQQNGQWFYTTREGEEKGPFDSREDAEGELITYIRERHKLEDFGQ
jgi:uncharacterized protein YchJ